MAGKVLVVDDVLSPDAMACHIAGQYSAWETLREPKVQEWKEVQQYVFATDTGKTKNNSLPWSNKTTLPKLCQIRDNLIANYLATLFPKRKWLVWEGSREKDEEKTKRKTIEQYMAWILSRNEFYQEVSKIVADYIDYGNCIATVEWTNNSQTTNKGEKIGYIGPSAKRISPLDIVFNPIAPSFTQAPKIIRSFVSIGEVQEIIQGRKGTSPEEVEEAKELLDYFFKYRSELTSYPETLEVKDDIYRISGFTDYRSYLDCGVVELLTFYGDVYDENTRIFHKNKIITVVDRHKVISLEDNPSFFGHSPIYHAGWRIRPDSLWAMGPLDNLVGMQYRIDHLENMKADVFDVIAYPPLKIKGYVEDFSWGPMERIYVGDDGDVSMLAPDTQALQADTQIAILEAKMEEMAGSPKEAMGFRTPGEKTAFEVQRLELAAGRIFQNKIANFEREILEPLVNAMLEMARRFMSSDTTVRVFDMENKIAVFKDLTPEDITGQGRLKPIAARHFAEKANQVQTLNSFFSSASASDPNVRMHFSGVELARLWEQLLDLEDYKIVEPYIGITEQADAQRIQNTVQQQVAQEANTPAGIMPGDSDFSLEELENGQIRS